MAKKNNDAAEAKCGCGMKLQPLGDRVVIKQDDAEQTTAAGLYIASETKEKPSSGIVLAVGEGKRNFTGVSEYAVFWTADEAGEEAVVRYIYQDKDILYRGTMLKDEFAATVRCVKE